MWVLILSRGDIKGGKGFKREGHLGWGPPCRYPPPVIDLNEIYTKGQGCSNRCITETERNLIYYFRLLKPFQKAAVTAWVERKLAENDFSKSRVAEERARQEYEALLDGLATWAWARRQRKVGWARQRKIEVLTKGY